MRFVVLLVLFLTNLSFAQDNLPPPDMKVESLGKPIGKPIIKNLVKPKPFAISHNVVFVVDASSTMYDEAEIQNKFELGWNTIVNKFASDELYYRVYIFSDRYEEKCSKKWISAGGPGGLKKFDKTKKWIIANVGTRSWGLKSLRMALREKCPFDKNPATKARLTVVLITDGGFTETAGNRPKDKKKANELDKRALKGEYENTGSFIVFDKAIAIEQAWRKKNKLTPAVIVTIGIQNDAPQWGISVKRPDKECQAWLKKIGEKYDGGYFFVKRAPEKIKTKKRAE